MVIKHSEKGINKKGEKPIFKLFTQSYPKGNHKKIFLFRHRKLSDFVPTRSSYDIRSVRRRHPPADPEFSADS